MVCLLCMTGEAEALQPLLAQPVELSDLAQRIAPNQPHRSHDYPE
jgi:hypothetical protein